MADEVDVDDEEVVKAKSQQEMVPVLVEQRHLEEIRAAYMEPHWRMKDRMKTVSVAIVLCLNLPVDPPDVVKLQPCARLEAWVDPTSMSSNKAIEAIKGNLHKAYERGQPKARYKISQDPTTDDIKKLLLPLRRNAKEERVLFHYNGHGVPRPTDNGEIWVFNSNYTQYIPLSIYELQQWMGSPSVYVYDCCHAEKIIKLFKSFDSVYDEYKNIQLAACSDTEMLPQNPDLPADLFTSCLTTPVKMAIRYYWLQTKNRLLPKLTLEMLDKIPGQLSDRRSMLGELNWIFTAITDTIAWNTLPRALFHRLFRQDLLVASLFRNFLLAQRIMRSYDCTPKSSPEIPSAYHHHMWDAWDLALEKSLSQLPKILKLNDPATGYSASPFFENQLTAFQVWLKLGSTKRPAPEQLPIVLQVLLSQVYRPRALELLGTFLGLGPWAVNLVLEVGIFPYILKLLQSTAKELRPLLTLLWAKILAVDPTCRSDLVKENGHKYFTNILKDNSLKAEYRTMACFVMCSLVTDCSVGQISALQCNILPLCLELLVDPHPPLRQWAALTAGRTWNLLPIARWEATRDNGHEKVTELLKDSIPEIRAAAVFALGTFIRSLSLGDDGDQGRSINFNIGISLAELVNIEASPLVRKELVVALQYIVLTYENIFCDITKEYYSNIFTVAASENRKNSRLSTSSLTRITADSPLSGVGLTSASSANDISLLMTSNSHRREVSKTLTGGSRLSHGRLQLKIWVAIIELENDPDPAVSVLASEIVKFFKSQALNLVTEESTAQFNLTNGHYETFSVPTSKGTSLSEIQMTNVEFVVPIVGTHFVEWCTTSFIKSKEKKGKKAPNVDDLYEELLKTKLDKKQKIDPNLLLTTYKFEDQIFVHKASQTPSSVMFHPTDPILIVANRRGVTFYDTETGTKKNSFDNGNEGPNQITAMTFINTGLPGPYMCIGCDDGSVKVWTDCLNMPEGTKPVATPAYRSHNRSLAVDEDTTHPAKLVTAFQALEDVGPSKRGSGLLMSWEQSERILAVAGDSKFIRLWDMTTETFSRDINTESTCTTSLHSEEGYPWFVAGFSNGYIRLFDRRIFSSIARQWRPKNSCVLMTELINPSASSTQIISGLDSGEVYLHDLRRASSMPIDLNLQDNFKALTMAYHQSGRIFATGSLTCQISIAHTNNKKINSIRHYSGFTGHKIGPVNCLAFHPTEFQLAAGTTEGIVSVHSVVRR